MSPFHFVAISVHHYNLHVHVTCTMFVYGYDNCRSDNLQTSIQINHLTHVNARERLVDSLIWSKSSLQRRVLCNPHKYFTDYIDPIEYIH